MKHLRIIRCVAACLAFLVSPALAQNTQGGTRIIALPGSSGGGTFPPSGCSTSNGVIFNNSTPCDSGLLYAGSNGPITSNGAIFGGAGAADFQFGAANVNGSPVAQTLSFQGALAGSASNTASASTTIVGSLGTGTGTNGDVIIQTGVKTTTGSAQATPTTALTIKGETGRVAVAAVGSAAAPSLSVGNATTGFYSASTTTLGLSVNGTSVINYASGILNLQATIVRLGTSTVLVDVGSAAALSVGSGYGFGWSSTAGAAAGNDTTLSRNAAGVVQVGTSGNNALGSLLLTALTSTGAVDMTNLPTSTPGGTPSTVCWDSTAGALWTDASATGPCGIVSALRFKNLIEGDPQINIAGLDNLRVGPWTYKPGQRDNGSKIHIGLIADEVAAMDWRCGDGETPTDEVTNYEDRCVLAYLVADRKVLKSRITELERKTAWIDALQPYSPSHSDHMPLVSPAQ